MAQSLVSIYIPLSKPHHDSIELWPVPVLCDNAANLTINDPTLRMRSCCAKSLLVFTASPQSNMSNPILLMY